VTGQRIGYVRVSTLDQNEKRQLERGLRPGHRRARAHGATSVRPRRDTVVVHSMDRLARNLDDLRALVRA
jgi:DNA invertase Pin-like site-specific DNA recombinase